MQQIILDHHRRYPEMTARDFFKLLYQSEFGGGHLIASRDMALARLKDEIAEVGHAPKRLFEDIGGGLLRMYLPADALRPETVCGLFCLTCNPRGSIEGMHDKLEQLRAIFPEISGDIDAYIAEGCPAQRHSEVYRAAYAPAYRLVPQEARTYLALFQRIDALLREKPFVRIAIDGRCGAGKSTLGAMLAYVYQANLFHMDDYFLPFARKTPERLAEPGGNVDYERFYEEIASRPAGSEVVWHPFDCGRQGLGEEIRTSPTPLTVVEGSYALHPTLRDSYDLKVFLDIDPKQQSDRILRRNPEMHHRFINEWIPLENRYFDGLNIRSLCDLAFDA